MSSTKSSYSRSLLQAFKQKEEGSVAIIFGLASMAVVLVAGAAVDYGRIIRVESRVTAATDAAALAAAKSLRDGAANDSTVRDVASKYFSENIRGIDATVTGLDVQIDHKLSAITIKTTTSVDLTFMKLAGFQSMSLPKSAVAIYKSKDIELGLQLDVTGSMCQTPSGANDPSCSKLKALKVSVSDLLDIMMPTGAAANKVRIGLAPFAGGVNAGAYAMAVSGGKATNGCVYERHNLVDQATEALPFGVQAYRAKSELTPPRGYGIQDCPTDAKLVALSSDKEMLRSTVNGWSKSGSTAGHLGAAWAWNLISPNWAPVWPVASAPVAYNDGRTIKAVILMTDGIYNTIGGWSDGDNSSTATQSTKVAKDTCDAMKAQGIIVYTIGFEAPAAAKASLKACATDGSKFFDAADETKLKAAFRAVAAELSSLRLSQ